MQTQAKMQNDIIKKLPLSREHISKMLWVNKAKLQPDKLRGFLRMPNNCCAKSDLVSKRVTYST